MLADIVAPGLDVLFCGTAAGHASAARGHYYAGPGNRFWPMLAETGLTPRRLRPEEDHLMPGFGLGLTDLAKDVSGMDREIPPAAFAPARLLALVCDLRPRALAFTSLTAARLALGQPALRPGRVAAAGLADTVVFALPSPSGAARGTFDPAPWQALADWRQRCGG
ncbi:MAG: mismatch-specific DNA-glycosylase [Paracoccaceae bacterium]